jgi:uncharacterized delta-60 repeat protein
MRNFTKLVFILALAVLSHTSVLLAQQGSLDTTFGMNSTGIFQDPLPATSDATNVARYYGPIEVLANGQLVVAGTAYTSLGGGNYVTDFIVRRLNANGTADLSFGTDGTGSTQTTFYRYGAAPNQQSSNQGNVMAVQPSDGKIIIAGKCSGVGVGGSPLGTDLCMVRYNADGTLDTSFGGNTVTAYCGAGCAPQNYTMDAGKLWVYTGVNQVNGALNGGFNGSPVRIRFLPNNKIVVFGNSRDFVSPNQTGRTKGFALVLTTSGAVDSITSIFDTTGNSTVGFGQTNIYDGDLMSNGDYLTVGNQSRLVSTNPTVFTNPKFAIFRNGGAMFFDQANNNLTEAAYGLAQVRSNKILVGGSYAGSPVFVRYNGDLSVDTSFGTNGRIVPPCNANFCIGGAYVGTMLAQQDGKIIGFGDPGHIFRLNPDGSPDRSFALYTSGPDVLSSRGSLPNGRYSTSFATRPGTDTHLYYTGLNVRPNGQMVVTAKTGTSGFGNPVAQAAVLQLKTSFRNGGTFSDFNNDGKVELSVYRPTGGVWFTLDSFSGAPTADQWGLSTDKIAPADYDGDGKTDRAIFRDGVWWITESSNGQVKVVQWGSAGDLPRPGDFNGDGQADLAVFRPSNGIWYIQYSNPVQPGNQTVKIVQFGANGDIPLMGDFDGDGKSDISVFRSGVWYIIKSSTDAVSVTQFGITGDVPVVGDYDGDGSADITVFRSGLWYSIRSSDGRVAINQFGLAGDKPVPGDYDNDGKNDLAIYRNGTWWIQRSTDGQASATGFGLASDMPVPAAYLQAN